MAQAPEACSSARGARGVSLVELVVALTIFAVLLIAVLPYLSPRPMHLRADTNDLVSNLRLARDLAISRTTQYRIRVVDRTSYALERRDSQSGQWTTERLIRLREGVQFARTTRPEQGVEFNSRGRTPAAAVVLPFTLEDDRGNQRSVVVSPTGGVSEQ